MRLCHLTQPHQKHFIYRIILVGIVPLVAVWRGSICRNYLITTDNKTAFSEF